MFLVCPQAISRPEVVAMALPLSLDLQAERNKNPRDRQTALFLGAKDRSGRLWEE